jgi:ethanolamine ammonia-lyase large subunit
VKTIPNAVPVRTLSKDREDYIAHPATGEKLSPESVATIEKLRDSWGEEGPNAVIVISDGLNAKAIMDEGHLAPYLDEIRKRLTEGGAVVCEKNIVVTGGRVRAGYEIGKLLYKNADPNRYKGILHIIGERPGTMHHSYSVYITAPQGQAWVEGRINHDITRLVCNIADTALPPKEAAEETETIIREMVGKNAPSTRSYR